MPYSEADAEVDCKSHFHRRALHLTAFLNFLSTHSVILGLSGGFAKSDSPKPGGPLVIPYADDLAETQRRLESVGAKIVNPLFSFPGGRRFHFEDPDGYELAVWSDK